MFKPNTGIQKNGDVIGFKLGLLFSVLNNALIERQYKLKIYFFVKPRQTVEPKNTG